MGSEYWEYANWITKVTLYLSVACIIGGLFCYFLFYRYLDFQKKILHYIGFSTCLGFFSSLLGLGVLIGSFADAGILGMFDTNYAKIILSTATGMVHVVRITCFALLIALMGGIFTHHKVRMYMWEKVSFFFLLIPIIYSFSQLGHSANLSIFPQILLSVHVLVMSLWMGSLYPLCMATLKISGLELQQRIHLFGRIASVMMVILLLCGLSVALLLIKHVDVLLTTAYGYGFILKLCLVAVILLLAAVNKWYLTPRLEIPAFAKKLTYAIFFEILIGLSILATTGYITTVVGIE